MDSFIGTYSNDGYGTVAVARDCAWDESSDAPTALSIVDGSCVLRVQKGNTFGNPISYRLQHVSSSSWIAWLYMDDYALMKRPSACYRAQFELDGRGMPARFGIDMRDESADTPLVWFNRTNS